MDNTEVKINDLRFNLDSSCFSCATNDGFKIFTTHPLKEIIKRDVCELGELTQVELLEKTNIIAFVGSPNNPKYPKNKLILWDDDFQRPVGDIQFSSDIMGFKLYRDRIVVALLTVTYLYDLQTLQLISTVETVANQYGLCELNRSGKKAFVTLGKRPGSVRVSFPESKNTQIKEIQAHEGPLRHIKLDRSGQYLATCSDKGTLIRVFDLTRNELKPVFVFRRGIDHATISSITFDPTSKWLCVSSNTETIHLFSMEASAAGWDWSWVKSYYTDEKTSTITLKLPREVEGAMSICCFSQQLNMVFAVCNNGCLYRYSIDLNSPVRDKAPDSFNPFNSELC